MIKQTTLIIDQGTTIELLENKQLKISEGQKVQFIKYQGHVEIVNHCIIFDNHINVSDQPFEVKKRKYKPRASKDNNDAETPSKRKGPGRPKKNTAADSAAA